MVSGEVVGSFFFGEEETDGFIYPLSPIRTQRKKRERDITQ